MIAAVWAPLLLPFLAAPLARRLAEALTPRAAAWTLAGTAAVLAGGTLCSLGLLTAAGLLQLPPVAALGHLSLPWLTAAAPQAALPAALAGLALTVLAVLGVRTAWLRRRELHAARATLDPEDGGHPGNDAPQPGDDRHPDVRPLSASVRHARAQAARRAPLVERARALLRPAGPHPLAVLDDERADAFALPGRLPRPGRPAEPGRIVVTAGMLRALTAPERAALLAHERAHLTARHHVFLALAEHAAAVHPALRTLRTPLGYHLERWADEAAAERVGDRAVTARAVGRAALAASRSPRPARPRLAPAAHSGPVPRRVAALLQPRPAASRTGRRAAALALAACLALTAATTLDATADLHRTVESAQQGIEPRP
ncbi:M56 family metallopeptidase [Streptomyces sp. CB01881]|uniref:M56 family metallopeptidase n=1 Tax=Streptomyces sp. CB01881 TaxID=2078691 RepID=UPI001F11DEAF|nr:M56 family metallopeptidase [Streptomyces sp. CB01881]